MIPTRKVEWHGNDQVVATATMFLWHLFERTLAHNTHVVMTLLAPDKKSAEAQAFDIFNRPMDAFLVRKEEEGVTHVGPIQQEERN